MIDDLIDLYYYIRSTEDIRDIVGWNYKDHHGMHGINLIVCWNATFTNQLWNFKLAVGNVYDYRQFFLSQDKVEICKTGGYHYATPVSGFITEEASDNLMNFISTEEIALMNQIYLEMLKLKNRSRPYERSNP